jgi:Zn finger protein HypA/HybF involved in hydrogenase expression
MKLADVKMWCNNCGHETDIVATKFKGLCPECNEYELRLYTGDALIWFEKYSNTLKELVA